MMRFPRVRAMPGGAADPHMGTENEPTPSTSHPEAQSPEATGATFPETPSHEARNRTPASAYRDVLRREWDPRHRLRPRVGHSHFVKNLRLVQQLERHAGCVNTVAWSEDASLLLSGSDDLCVCVWSVGTGFPCLGTVYTGHNHNIFSAEFVPGTNGGKCVTTAGDGDVRIVDLVRGFERGESRIPERQPFRTRRFGFDDENNDGTVSRSLLAGRADDPNELGDVMGMKVRFVPGAPNVLLATHQDGRVRRFDLRQSPRETGDVVVDLSVQGGCSDLAFDPSAPSLFALGCDDPFVRVFDVRHLRETPRDSRARARSPSEREHADAIPVVAKYSPGKSHGFNTRSLRFDGVSGLAYGKRGELAVTYRGEHLYVIDQRAYEIRRAIVPEMSRGIPDAGARGDEHGTVGTEWGGLDHLSRTMRGAMFGPGGTGSPPPAGAESPEFGYASPDTSGRGSGSDSDDDDDTDSEDDDENAARDGDETAAAGRRSVSVPRDRVLSPRGGRGWDLFDEDQTHRPMEHDDPAVRRYVGHKNVKTFLKSVAFMCDDAYVSTGSDCGGMFVWDVRTCELALKVQADSQVVNNVCPHPSLPMVVTSGIDDVMRVWEGGYGRHLLDLPEAHPDDSFDEMELWDSEGRLDSEDEFFPTGFPRAPRHDEDEESSSSDDEDEENESEHVHDAEEEADPTDRLSDHTAAEPLEAADREEETENESGGEPTEPSSKKHRAGPS